MILERLLRTLRLLLRILRLLRTPRLTDPTIPTTHTTPGTESSEAVLVSLSLSLTHQVRTASAHARVSRQHDRRGRKGSAARRHSQALDRQKGLSGPERDGMGYAPAKLAPGMAHLRRARAWAETKVLCGCSVQSHQHTLPARSSARQCSARRGRGRKEMQLTTARVVQGGRGSVMDASRLVPSPTSWVRRGRQRGSGASKHASQQRSDRGRFGLTSQNQRTVAPEQNRSQVHARGYLWTSGAPAGTPCQPWADPVLPKPSAHTQRTQV